MFEGFTESAIKVVLLALEEARRLGHDSIGTECLLVGIILEQRGLAAKALRAAGLNRERIRVEVEKIIGRGGGFGGVEMPLTPRAKEVVEKARQKALELGDHHTDTEHLLLSILDLDDGFAIRALENLNVDRVALSQDVLKLREGFIQAQKEALPLTFKQGDVVLVLIEFTDDSGTVIKKRRSMVVISSNDCIPRLKHITVVPLVAHSRDSVLDPSDLLISAASQAGKLGGLEQDSIASCTFVYSYPRDWFVAKIGSLPRETINQICSQVWGIIKPAD